MKINHLIITRFLNNDKMNLGRRVLDKDVIDNGINLYKRYLLPSLSHQSNKNFTHILIIHDEVNPQFIQDLYKIAESAPYKTEILTKKQYEEYARSKFENCDVFITSRVDYDDAFYYDAVNDIQKCKMCSPVMVYTWRNGLLSKAFTDEYYQYKYISSNREKVRGSVSIMLSLLIDRSKIDAYHNVYEYNHTLICEQLSGTSLNTNNAPAYDLIYINERKEPCWVAIKHDLNDSSVNGSSHKDKALSKVDPVKFDTKTFYNL